MATDDVSKQKELMEKIKNMSPEELKEFQKKQCIFCQIISGKMQGKKVYEDDKSIAILDINPANVGHILLLPKEHYSIMPQIPEDEIKHLGIVSKKLSHAALKGLKSQGTSIFIANGVAAGQRAQHFMVHIIPRKENDNVGIFIPQTQISEDDLLKLHEVIQNKVNQIFGIKKEIVTGKGEQKEKMKNVSTKNKGDSTGEIEGERIKDEGIEDDDKNKKNGEEKTVTKKKLKDEANVSNGKKDVKNKSRQKKSDKTEDNVSLDDIANLFG